MNMEWLKRLIRLVEESDIDSLEVERLTTRVRIRKTPTGGATVAHVAPAPAAAPAPAMPAAPGAAAPVAEDAAAVPDGLHDVQSPMVGTFYRSPSPESDPFVSVGDAVEPGQTLCILEAMKLMNELKAEIGGTIREIAVENAEPVEFGQVLFRIEPS
ncbi:MAG: acetyl-CoA carboxylase biotin carboxyl carrier protein [Gemmatimonadota bacterium]|nr:acetyl-CoA carboxylase biotin carboxyl carrier protein [Gemmatimonadota bacterium]